MAYRLYIVGPEMTRAEFEAAKVDLPCLELDTLYVALAAATDYLQTGLNAIIEGDDGTRLEADQIRAQIERPRNRE
jgi:hypothetical protein